MFSMSKRHIQQARSLRKRQTPAEQILWEKIRNRRINDKKFRRQVPVGPYVVDFLCCELKLVIEVDGDVHAGKEEYDLSREKYLEEKGYHIIRFTNGEIFYELENVLHRLFDVTLNSPLPEGEG